MNCAAWVSLLWVAAWANPGLADTTGYTYDEAGRLIQVRYSSGQTMTYTYDAAGNLLRRLVTGPSQAGPNPVTSAEAVVNAASFLGGSVAPGEIVTIFGTNIGPPSPSGFRLGSAGVFDTFVADTQILFDAAPAPVVFVSQGQSSVIVPYAVAGKSATQMVVEYQGRRSAPVSLPVAVAAPALFSTSSGRGQGAILNEDGTVNSESNPAAKGSIMVLFGTGEGKTDPPGVDGKLAAGVFPKPLLPVSVRIGGLEANVLYAGAAPGLVAGVFQVNARMSADVPSGAIPVVVTVGGLASQAGLTVTVR